MAHFAKLDEDKFVTQVIVISNLDIIDENGNESEQMGIDLCKKLVDTNGTFVQTSYNNNFRKMFGVVGFKYSPTADVFYNPVGPFPSWVLDENFDWQPPIPIPTEDATFRWDEDTLSWVKLPATEESEDA